jgi:FlaA1/EpsC-like NDP-sugar epimerase
MLLMQVPAKIAESISARSDFLVKARNRHFLLLDMLLLILTPWTALALRLDGVDALAPYVSSCLAYTVLALAIRLALFVPFGLYNRYWRSATVEELGQTVRAVAASALVITFLFFLSGQFRFAGASLPRSLPLLDSLLVLMGVGGLRFGMRYGHRVVRERPSAGAKRILVAGAGDAGIMIARELLSNPQLELRPVGFLDDDPRKHNVRIVNLPVFGGRECLAEVVARENIAQVIIAMPTAPGSVIRDFRELCEQANVPAKTVPGMYEILSGKVGVNQLRNVDIEDLLRREPVQTDIAAVRELVRGRRVMVTGAGGSIGSELCRQVLQCHPVESGRAW